MLSNRAVLAATAIRPRVAFMASAAAGISGSASGSGSVLSTASRRLAQIGQHMMASTSAGQPQAKDAQENKPQEVEEELVLFESNLSSRMYKLNRPRKFNSLNHEMVNLLRPKIDAWAQSDLCKVIIGTGGVRPFCAGGDVAHIAKLAEANNHRDAISYFKDEFELDFALARMNKPYVVIMEGVTMGGGAGLAYPAQLRVATTNTEFAMPETKIGFSPDVGSNYYLAQLDGYIGAWMAVTAQSVYGRAVYELGIASHYVPQSSLPDLVAAIQQFEDPTLARLASLISTYSAPPPTASARSQQSTKQTSDAPTHFTGAIRRALDEAFSQPSVEGIIAKLQEQTQSGESDAVKEWAMEQLEAIDLRSPTGMKVALAGYRKARASRQLKAVMNNDLAMVTAYLSPATDEMVRGINHVLVKRSKDKAEWQPAVLSDPEIADAKILDTWFDRSHSPASQAPEISIPGGVPTGKNVPDTTWGVFRAWGLPPEQTVREYVEGSARSSDAFAITEQQLTDRLTADLVARIEGGGEDQGLLKVGIQEKVRDVVSRKCSTISEGGVSYLKWKSDK